MRRFEDVVRDLKKISKQTIRTINRIKPETLESFGIIARARNGGYICPFCHNGEGTNGTGVEPLVKDSHVGWHCFTCGKNFNNVGILAEHFQLNTKTDFEPLVEKICAVFKIPCEYDDFAPPSYQRTKSKMKKDEPIDEAELALIRQDLAVSDEPLRRMVDWSPEKSWRGLPIEILLQFGCRLISDWTPPSLRKIKQGLTGEPTPRLIVPAGDSYLARLTIPLQSFDAKKRSSIIEKIHAGKKNLFNPAALQSDEPIFCLEGAIDAMSAVYAGFPAVAIHGADRADLLVDAVNQMPEDKPQVIILLDSDATGRKAAVKLHAELISVGCPCVVRFLAGDDSKIDCNEILTKSGVDALRGKLQSIVDDSLAELAAVNREFAERKSQRLADDDLNFYFDGDASDLDFAYRLERFCGSDVRWLSDDERWLIYGNGVWTRGSEKNSCVSYFGRELANVLNEFAQDDAERKLANAFKSAKKIGQAATLLKSCDSIRIKAKDLDNHAELLNFQNCVVDLSDGEIYPHDDTRLKFLTQQCAAVYNSHAQSALVDKFFRDIMPDDETRAGLLRWLGYCLTGETSEEKFAVWTGESGANGKSTLSATILELLGTYACELPTRALLRKRFDSGDADRATTALNGIENSRFAISQELPADSELDSALIKNLSGSDHIPLRKNYDEYRTVRATAKINLCGNYTPKIENIFDGGILRRLINFNFAVRFGTPEHPADFALKKKLLLPENLSALAAILVRESVAWYQGSGLIISSLMKKATEQHLSQNDFISDFISDNYLLLPNASVKAKDFIDELKHEYPRECSRFKRNDLIKLIEKVDGVTYCEDRKRFKVFRGIGKAADDLGGEPVNPNTANPFDDLPI